MMFELSFYYLVTRSNSYDNAMAQWLLQSVSMDIFDVIPPELFLYILTGIPVASKSVMHNCMFVNMEATAN